MRSCCVVLGIVVGCVPEPTPLALEPSTPQTELVSCPATAGGDGGAGGEVSLRYAQAVSTVEILATGGIGGAGGVGDPPSEPGAPGGAGSIEVYQDIGWQFDGAGIDPGWTFRVDSEGVSLDVSTTDLDVIEVETFELLDGASVWFHDDVTVRARTVFLSTGSRLHVRAGGEQILTVGEIAEGVGSEGGVLTIEAETVRIEGTLDVNGAGGVEPGEPGGAAGRVMLAAAHVEMASGKIEALGGAGADGLDEAPCPSPPGS